MPGAADREGAFLAVRLQATADITLECRPYAGCENRRVGKVVVEEQGQRKLAVIGEGQLFDTLEFACRAFDRS